MLTGISTSTISRYLSIITWYLITIYNNFKFYKKSVKKNVLFIFNTFNFCDFYYLPILVDVKLMYRILNELMIKIKILKLKAQNYKKPFSKNCPKKKSPTWVY